MLIELNLILLAQSPGGTPTVLPIRTGQGAHWALFYQQVDVPQRPPLPSSVDKYTLPKADGETLETVQHQPGP